MPAKRYTFNHVQQCIFHAHLWKTRVTNYCYTGFLLSVTQLLLRVTLLIVYGYTLLTLDFRG
jgi:hypothetical protein